MKLGVILAFLFPAVISVGLPSLPTEQVTWQEVREIVPAGVEWWVQDSNYWVINAEDLEKLLRWDWTDRMPFVAERRDCDDLARSFVVHVSEAFGLNSVGVVYYRGHAENAIVVRHGESLRLWLVRAHSDVYERWFPRTARLVL